MNNNTPKPAVDLDAINTKLASQAERPIGDDEPDFREVWPGPTSTTLLTVDPEFNNLLPQLTAEELAQLERSLASDHEAFPPIAVWENGGGIILDGHNQHRLRQKLGLSIHIRPYRFKTRAEALRFALERQIGRRNMSASQLAMLAAKFPAKPAHRPSRSAPSGALSQTDAAAVTGSNRRSVQRAKVIRTNAAPEVVEAVETGAVTLNDAESVALKPRRVQVAAVNKVKAGKATTLKMAVNGREIQKPADRKQARVAYGKLLRTLDAIGISAAVDEELKAILRMIDSPGSGVTADWGAGDSLEEVQSDLREFKRRCGELNKFARTVLRCDGQNITRPFCSEYSLLTISHPLLHVGRCIANDMPVGGTAKKPILFHEQKAIELAK